MPSMFREPRAAHVVESAYVGLGSNVIVPKRKGLSLKYLVALLNSRLAKAWFQIYGKHRGAGVDIGVKKLRSFPLPDSFVDDQAELSGRADRILDMKQRDRNANVHEVEKEIDELVYKLYDLTDESIAIVEEQAPLA